MPKGWLRLKGGNNRKRPSIFAFSNCLSNFSVNIRYSFYNIKGVSNPFQSNFKTHKLSSRSYNLALVQVAIYYRGWGPDPKFPLVRLFRTKLSMIVLSRLKLPLIRESRLKLLLIRLSRLRRCLIRLNLDDSGSRN